MLVYKYAHKHGLDILRLLEIKVSLPAEFNDPFEFMPVVPRYTPPRIIKKVLKNKEMQKHMHGMATAAGFNLSFKEFRNSVRQNQQKLVSVSASNPDLPKKIRDEIMAKPLSNIGIFCMSAVPDSILMWSHYADSHRGIVIGIDVQQACQQWADDLLKVEYNDGRVDLNLKWLPGSLEYRKFGETILKVKSPAWKYEQEYRLGFRLATLRPRQLKDGSTAYFSMIPPVAIREVILGCRCAPETERDVRNALAIDQFKHVTLKRALIHDTDFKLILNPA